MSECNESISKSCSTLTFATNGSDKLLQVLACLHSTIVTTLRSRTKDTNASYAHNKLKSRKLPRENAIIFGENCFFVREKFNQCL